MGHVLGSGKRLNSCRDKKKGGISRQRGSTFLLVGIYDLEDEKGSKFLKMCCFFNPRVCLHAYVALQVSLDTCTIGSAQYMLTEGSWS